MPIRSNLLVNDHPEHSLLPELAASDALARLWRKDYTLWSDSPTEISNRLGWLDSPRLMSKQVDDLHAFAAEIRAEFSDVVLLGMGGSSLAPEVFARTFGPAEGFPALHIQDTTDPAAILNITRTLDPEDTLYIVSTKSGGTIETLSLFKYFYNLTRTAVGKKRAGQHFIAITDPGSGLEEAAAAFKFHRTFLNDPDIGGRFSVLSYFGLVPAALLGIRLDLLLEQARAGAHADSPNSAASPGLHLGAALAYALGQGRDKLTFITSADLAPFCDWAEQLIAESTGKEGFGILPVIGEDADDLALSSPDRQFIGLTYTDDTRPLGRLSKLRQPAATFILEDEYDLAALFFHFEVATAIVCHLMGINPFDQPDVEAAKRHGRVVAEAFQTEGRLPPAETAPLTLEALQGFLALAEPHGYIALHAYLHPRPETTATLRRLQSAIVGHTGRPCTLGYGPRFLHSTGQLHKGDNGLGLFIQFVSPPVEDVPIPDEPGQPASQMTFGVLKQAQALGDAAALQAVGRKVITFTLPEEELPTLDRLAERL